MIPPILGTNNADYLERLCPILEREKIHPSGVVRLRNAAFCEERGIEQLSSLAEHTALLENEDYYPDGRDLGENFTFTSWLSAPCVRAGKLECIFCHTSSGRFRQAKDPDQACLPCHKDKEAGLDKHTRHKPESPGSRCIACHMPKTDFARMSRSDHSMRPPAPAATASFGSPNACLGCHQDKDAAWADALVRQWRPRDYQAPMLARARHILEARQRNFSQLPAMLASLTEPGRDSVYAASMLRLLRACPYCGAELSREAAARGWEIPGPSELEKKLAKENNPKKKYKLILAALEKDPQLGLV